MAGKKASGNPRTRALLSLCIVFVLIVVAGYLALFGFGKGRMINYMKPWGEAISLGLDLRGGVYTVYQAKNPNEEDLDSKMNSTISILMSRLTRQGFTEANVTRQGTDRIRVEIPNVSDPNEILTIIGTPAKLEFTDSNGTVLMDGSMVQNAQAAQDENGQAIVDFTLNEEGAKIFADATAEHKRCLRRQKFQRLPMCANSAVLESPKWKGANANGSAPPLAVRNGGTRTVSS